jgi:UDP-2,4-diacetamido-2,4,6-trideoxy-beta-L-altropyranose hydrolase
VLHDSKGYKTNSMASDRTSNPPVTLRSVTAEDCKMIWEWANDPTIRSVSFSSEPISWEYHSQWFQAKLIDSNCLFFIALDADGIPIGQIRYELQATEAVVSVSLAFGQRGKGYGVHIIQSASQQVFESTAVRLIHAYIKPDNLSSIRAFTRAGFSDFGPVNVNGNFARDYRIQRKSENNES